MEEGPDGDGDGDGDVLVDEAEEGRAGGRDQLWCVDGNGGGLSLLCDHAALVAFALGLELDQRPEGAHLAEEVHDLEGGGGIFAVEQLVEENQEHGELLVEGGDAGPLAREGDVGAREGGGIGVLDDFGDFGEHAVVDAEDHGGHDAGGGQGGQQDGGGEVEVDHGCGWARMQREEKRGEERGREGGREGRGSNNMEGSEVRFS